MDEARWHARYDAHLQRLDDGYLWTPETYFPGRSPEGACEDDWMLAKFDQGADAWQRTSRMLRPSSAPPPAALVLRSMQQVRDAADLDLLSSDSWAASVLRRAACREEHRVKKRP